MSRDHIALFILLDQLGSQPARVTTLDDGATHRVHIDGHGLEVALVVPVEGAQLLVRRQGALDVPGGDLLATGEDVTLRQRSISGRQLDGRTFGRGLFATLDLVGQQECIVRQLARLTQVPEVTAHLVLLVDRVALRCGGHLGEEGVELLLAHADVHGDLTQRLGAVPLGHAEVLALLDQCVDLLAGSRAVQQVLHSGGVLRCLAFGPGLVDHGHTGKVFLLHAGCVHPLGARHQRKASALRCRCWRLL